MRIGVDLGGTKIEGIVLDAGGEELARRRVSTPREDYEGTLEAVATLVRELEKKVGRKATVGVGTPGAISPATGLIKNANSTWLNGRALREDLEGLLEQEVRIANDANCFTLSEATDGAGAGARVVFGVIVGTGTGGGIVVGGKLLEGPNAIAGEWGHNPLPWPRSEEWLGPACYCGQVGCVEMFLSGPGMRRDHAAQTGMELEPPEIVRRAGDRDYQAKRTLERYVDRMARALAGVINVLDPDVIVLGGGMSNLGSLYEEVPRKWGAYVFSDQVDTPLLPPRHGDASGVRGAAWLWGEGEQGDAGLAPR
jgi:fructokinase